MSLHERRDARFERELRQASLGLASEPLPRDILAAPVSVSGRRPGAAVGVGGVVLVAAAAIVVAVWLGARLLPSGDGASFRPPTAIELELRTSGYRCITAPHPTPRPGSTATPAAPSPTGSPRPTVPPGGNDLVCTTPDALAPVVGAYILELDSGGAIVLAHAKAGILGTPNVASEGARVELLATFVGLGFADPGEAEAARSWLRARVPVESGLTVETTIAGVALSLSRDTDDGYELELTPSSAAPGGG